MMKKLAGLFLFVAMALPAFAQNPTIIVAGTNITISPSSGVGRVTINSTGGGGTAGVTNSQMFVTNFTAIKVIVPYVRLTDAPTITNNWNNGTKFDVVLGGNRTLQNPSGTLRNGDVVNYKFIQDGTGSRTLAFGTMFTNGIDVTSFILTTNANHCDFLTVEIGISEDLTVTNAFRKAFTRGYPSN